MRGRLMLASLLYQLHAHKSTNSGLFFSIHLNMKHLRSFFIQSVKISHENLCCNLITCVFNIVFFEFNSTIKIDLAKKNNKKDNIIQNKVV